MYRKLILFISPLVFALLCPSALNAELDRFYLDIIRTAFMNGYVRAIDTDTKTIQKLKEDRDYMRKRIVYETDHYLIRVAEMNRGLPGQVAVDKTTKAMRKTVW